jgi:hypothetical protein
LFAVLVGFWFVRTRHQPSILQAKDGKQIDQKVIVPAPEPPAPSGTEPRQIANVKPVIEKHSQPNLIARHERHVPRTGVREPELTAQEMAEKEQVLVALRLVSFKLNLAQRKTQGGPQLNPIRNQHKIG